MFLPPWYQPHVVQPISEPTTKLPYKKLQYPTYVKDTNLDAHIKVFKKAIQINGEVVEVNIINMFGFTFSHGIFQLSRAPLVDFSICGTHTIGLC
jgi:hypothetical protein